ncbi:AMP-binding protein [Consotaella aegiceratis]|uniref:AMP-binding protein n=1 Tax=Consotaella aegiceratis TaxID=3097961 RepID=UPI002F3F03EA
MFDRFCQLVEHAPDTPLYTFLREGGALAEAETWTAAETRDKIQSLATCLRDMVEPGARVLILLPPGLEFIRAFFACILSGAIAVPTMPANFSRHAGARHRITGILANSGIEIVLHDSAGGAGLRAALAGIVPEGVRWLATDTVDASGGDAPFRVDPDALAMLQYTSGSTGAPKGVQVGVRNIIHNARVIETAMAFGPQSRLVSWLPFFHDMGLFSGVIQPMLVGFPALLMPPATFIKSPVSWLNAVTAFNASVSGGPNFAYDLCVSRISDAEKADLNLGGWQVAFNGAEPIRAATLDRFAAAFESCGFRRESFYPCYGLAEATLMVTGAEVGQLVERRHLDRAAPNGDGAGPGAGDDPGRSSLELIASGRVHEERSAIGNRCAIVDPGTLRPCKPREVGEIVVSGDSVTRGYWNNTKATSEAIVTFELPGDPGPMPYLRTGDLGFMEDGYLFVTGRRKDVIILRGQNLYPHDIEETFEAETQLDESGGCVVFVLEDAAQTPVLVQQVSRQIWRLLRQETGTREVARIRERLEAARAMINAEHGLWLDRICLIKPMTLPKTTSGKVQRAATRALYEAGELRVGLELAEPSDGQQADMTEITCPVTRRVYDIWCAELGRTAFSLERDFFALGGSSLQAARIVARVNEAFGTEIELLDFVDQPNVPAIVARLKARSA